MILIEHSRRASYLRTCRLLAVGAMAVTAAYLYWLLVVARVDNVALFAILVVAELFNVSQALGFWYTISIQKWIEPESPKFEETSETVDIFITVCGEPADIVGKTVRGAVEIRHPRASVWILDDGPSAEIESIAAEHGAGYLTRSDRQGAKAGNINAAMAKTTGDYILILDADHCPHQAFLEKTLGAFSDSRMAFVQTPQVYTNGSTNRVAAGANCQQALFYGPILRGRAGGDAVFSCGTNVVFKRSSLDSIGGMPEDSITEDLRVSLLLLEKGYKSTYVPTVLAQGLGPTTVSDYFGQQMRWARGGLEILLKRGPFFRGMKRSAVLLYALGFQYWFTGWAYSIYLILPIVNLVFGLSPFHVPNNHPLFFIPYILVTFFTLIYAADYRLSFSAIWFTLAAFPVHVWSLISVLLGKTATFVVTPKVASAARRRGASRFQHVHLLVTLVLVGACVIGVALRGFTPSVMSNIAFAVGHIIIMQGFVRYHRQPAMAPAIIDERDAASPALAPLASHEQGVSLLPLPLLSAEQNEEKAV